MLYNIIMYVYQTGIAIYSHFNEKVKKMWTGERAAFGVLQKQVEPNAEYIWFHAASLGEFEQGRPLIERIKKEYPHYKILLTFFSPSGYEVRKKLRAGRYRYLSAHRHRCKCTEILACGAPGYGFLYKIRILVQLFAHFAPSQCTRLQCLKYISTQPNLFPTLWQTVCCRVEMFLPLLRTERFKQKTLGKNRHKRRYGRGRHTFRPCIANKRK